MFRYRVMYTTAEGRRHVADCARSLTIANSVARRRLTEGAQDVVIEVTMEDKNDDPDDPSWPPIENAA